MPMRLWSVVVRNASRPRARSGSRGSSATSGRSATVVTPHPPPCRPPTRPAARTARPRTRRGHDPHHVAHAPVVEAAELGAPADVAAGLGGRHGDLVLDLRDEVALGQE